MRAVLLAAMVLLQRPIAAMATEAAPPVERTGRVEVETPFGAIEILSLEEVARRGVVVPMRERALQAVAAAVAFDRTDRIVDYVLTVPIVVF